MKKFLQSLFVLMGVAMLIAACAKELQAPAEDLGGELQTVTFTAGIPTEMGTKAVADNDGNGALVNRCVMEIYYNGSLFERKYAAVNNKTATFTTDLPANRTYKVAFWADCVAQAGGAPTSSELETDLYYKTTDGLQAVALQGTYAGNTDARDAFALCREYTVAQGGSVLTAVLHRPFAQVNVITTDVATVAKVSTLKPDQVALTIKNAVTAYNVLDSTAVAGFTDDLTYTATLYNWNDSESECTLSMDYLFAEKTKAVIDIVWAAKKDGNTDVSHSFANIPYQRNYRTNIKGALLTTQGQWNVTVNPVWEVDTNGEFDVVYTTVCDIAGANDFVAKNNTKSEINVKFTSVPQDAGVPSTENNKNAIVTSLLASGATYNVDMLSDNQTIYVGDYDYTTTEEGVTTYDYNTILAASDEKTHNASVNIVINDAAYVGTMVVNSPSKSVSINGQELQSGKTYHIENLTITEVSSSTVVIEKGMIVNNLTITKGALKIFGKVNNVTVSDGATTATVKVRDCDSLSQDVYDKLKDYIDKPYYASHQNSTTPVTYDIRPTVCKIGETYYSYLADAVADVPDANETTITMISDHTIKGNAGVTIGTAKIVKLDLCSFTLKNAVNENKASQVINNQGTLTVFASGTGVMTNAVEEGTQPGEWWSDPKANYVTNVITNSGTLTMESGSIIETASGSICYGVDNQSGNGVATFNMKGGSIYKATGSAVRMYCNSTAQDNVINMTDGTIEGGYCAIWVQLPGSGAEKKKGTLNISGGTIKGGTYSWYDYSYGDIYDNVQYNLSGGVFDGGIFSFGGNFNITGGTYKSYVAIKQAKASNVAVTGGNFEGDCYTYGDNASTGFIKGGLFASKTYEYQGQPYYYNWLSLIADGYRVVANTDVSTSAKYPWKVEAGPVCKIGNVEFKSLEAAIAAVPTNGEETTVTLACDMGSSDAWIEYAKTYAQTLVAGQNMKLDLAGHKIWAKTTVNGETCFLRVNNGATLTITDSETGGAIYYLDGNDNTGGFVVCSAGRVNFNGGLLENKTHCVNSAIQGAVDIHANEWGTYYTNDTELYMTGGVLKSDNDNTLRLYDSSQTGSGKVNIKANISGGEIYGADAVFIMAQWYPQGSQYIVKDDIRMNNISLNVTGGTFETKNGIRVVGEVEEANNKEYKAININVTGGTFTTTDTEKYRVNKVAFQETAGWTSTEASTANLRSYTDVTWSIQ